MPDFSMKIAGQTAAVHALFESTPVYFQKYLTDGTPDFSITVRREDLAFEQQAALEEALAEGFRPRTFTDPFLERAAIARQFVHHLLQYDTLLLHGSAIACDGKGYLFTAKSGTGKSTHTRLWQQLLGSRAVMVNDDKPFVRLDREEITLYGSPWSGKHGLDANIAVPLAGICLLERGAENRIVPAVPRELAAMVRHQCQAPLDVAMLPHFHALVDALLRRAPLWHMYCTRDIAAAAMAFSAMTGL